MTIYSPKGKNTGVGVVVFPGGGYNCLAIDLEGMEICDWLTSRGITAVLLKYRVPLKKAGPYGESPLALEDAQRTLPTDKVPANIKNIKLLREAYHSL